MPSVTKATFTRAPRCRGSRLQELGERRADVALRLPPCRRLDCRGVGDERLPLHGTDALRDLPDLQGPPGDGAARLDDLEYRKRPAGADVEDGVALGRP